MRHLLSRIGTARSGPSKAVSATDATRDSGAAPDFASDVAPRVSSDTERRPASEFAAPRVGSDGSAASERRRQPSVTCITDRRASSYARRTGNARTGLTVAVLAVGDALRRDEGVDRL